MGVLDGRVAIVTGGARGIGRAYCTGFAEEGARVVMADIRFDDEDARKAADEIRAQGGLSIEIDVTRESDTQRLAAETIKKFGRVDVLVNNAAMYSGITTKGILEVPLDEWDKLMAVNLKGIFLCCRAIVPQMIKQKKGKIINITSEMAFDGGPGRMIHYVTSKGGVVSFTRTLATELGPHNVCVNAIGPGFTDTPASRTIRDLTTFDVGPTPLGRLQQPSDVVGAAVFLASDASNFMTGQTLIVDGGRFYH